MKHYTKLDDVLDGTCVDFSSSSGNGMQVMTAAAGRFGSCR
jgi:hypothetical protein